MNYFIKHIIVVFVLLFLFSCTQNRAFVASPFEPLVIKEKNEVQASLSVRTFKYGSLDVTYAFSNHIAVRTNVGGTVGLFNGMSSLIFFNNYKNINYFIAPLYNYQTNQIQRTTGIFLTNFRYYNYNCVYHSLGTALGISLSKAHYEIHFSVKPQYNFVDRYHYEYWYGNGAGRSSTYKVFDDEKLNNTIPSFFSIELSPSFIIKIEDKPLLKFQIGFLFCEKTFSHMYNFYSDYYDSIKETRTTAHPSSFPINATIGFIFSSKKKKS